MSRREREERKSRGGAGRDFLSGGGSKGRRAIKVPSGVDFYKVEEGKKPLVIVPYEAGEGNPERKKGELTPARHYFSHRDASPSGGPVICAKETFGEKCAICEYRRKLEQESKVDKDTIKALIPSARALFNVIDPTEKEPKVHVLDISNHCFFKTLKEEILGKKDDDLVETWWQPDGGVTLIVKWRKNKTGDFEFVEAKDISFEKRSKLRSGVLKQAVCLDELLEVPDYDEIKKNFGSDKSSSSDDSSDSSESNASSDSSDTSNKSEESSSSSENGSSESGSSESKSSESGSSESSDESKSSEESSESKSGESRSGGKTRRSKDGSKFSDESSASSESSESKSSDDDDSSSSES